MPLFERLVEDLIAMGWKRTLLSVKEKYGSLSFFAADLTSEMSARIDQAELESDTTCQACGAPGEEYTGPSGWVETLCELCRARRCQGRGEGGRETTSRRERWEEKLRRQAEPTAAWARRWNVLPGGLGNHPGVATYSGYAGYVRKGWIPILDRLAEDLVALGWNPRVLDQVKQKFGGLRFYIRGRVVVDMHGGDGLQTIDLYTEKGAFGEAIAHRIAEAEKESLKTCEECGASGARPAPVGGERGWIETLCPRCFEIEDTELRARRAAEEQEQAERDDEWQASEEEDARADPAYRAYLEEYVYPDELEERRGRPLRLAEIALAHASCRCGVCRRDLSSETWDAETSATWRREGRCPRCGPLREDRKP
jgi:hypothetical protein